VNIGGPDKFSFGDMARTITAKHGDDKTVVVDPQATYFGTLVDDEHSLVTVDDAVIAATRFTDWLAARLGEILGWLHQLTGSGAGAYEAGSTGFGLAQALTDAGADCVLAAPSKLPHPAGDRITAPRQDSLVRRDARR
jgi:hypothetical protein